ncbi:MAG: hypothetical protein A2X46_14155 [Lentisphaerae bacterium GWF2_57_35]|nr:MAG: hypothetical protein A2X46_14155 [Lentisphaerae bacterium GWF2_57_35]
MLSLSEPGLAQKVECVRVPFVANEGQLDNPSVRYYAQTFAGTVYVMQDGRVVYSLPSKATSDAQGWVLNETVLGAQLTQPQGKNRTEAQVSYFRGNDPAQWRSGLASWERVSLGEVYEGIELSLRAGGNNVEKIFTVQPSADPQQIQLAVAGAEALTVASDGALVVKTGFGDARFSAPVAFQDIDGQRKPVEVAYKVEGHRYGFELGAYDVSQALVIDPWLAATFLGGMSNEQAYAMARDSSGNIYVAGCVQSPNFPTTVGAYRRTLSSGGTMFGWGWSTYSFYGDVFVSKFNATLSSLLASTYLGGTNDDNCYAMRVDNSGNVFLAGRTKSTNFPTTVGAYKSLYTNNSVAASFVVKLGGSLTNLLASSMIRNLSGCGASDLQLDPSTNVYIVGSAYGLGGPYPGYYPTTPGAYMTNPPGTGERLIVSKFNSSLSTLLASTYLGTRNLGAFDYGYGLALDSATNVFVTGETSSTNFPTTAGAYMAGSPKGTNFAAYSSIIVSKFNSSLTTLLASTYMGSFSASHEEAYDIAVDSAGSVYITGKSEATNYPITAGVFDTTRGQASAPDAIVSKFNNSLTALQASICLGGPGIFDKELGYALAIDSAGNVVLAGSAVNVPTTAGAYTNKSNAFVARMNNTFTQLLACTYLPCTEYAGALVCENGTSIYVAGETDSGAPGAGFPTTLGAYDRTQNGLFDAFVARLTPDLRASIAPAITSPGNNAVFGRPVHIPLFAQAPQGGVLPSWVTQVVFYAGTTLVATDVAAPWSCVWSNVPAGLHSMTVRARDGAGQVWTSAAVNVRAEEAPSVTITNPLNNAVVYWKQTNRLCAVASDPDGAVTQVAFYAGAALVGRVSASPFCYSWTSAQAGTNILTARAWDNYGLCRTSAAIRLTVTNRNPSASITAPANNTYVYWKSTNTITATASDPDGWITNVAFYSSLKGLIANDSVSPYTVNWSTPCAGTHGLTAVATDNSGQRWTSTVVNLIVTNVPPTAALTAPTNGSVFFWKTTNILSATASDPDGTVTQVAFYTGTTLIGRDSVSPYSWNWTGGKAGVNALTARVWDNSSQCRTSSVVNVTITNLPPTGTLTNPLNGSVYGQIANLTLNATASDPDGTVSSVAFYAGSSNLGSDVSNPYSLPWNNIKAGVYALTVRITDNSSQVRTSAVVTITVTNNRPTVAMTSPTNGNVFVAPASITLNANAADADGVVTQVVFFAGSSNLGVDAVSPYSVSWLNVGVGSYALTARALDNSGGVSTSAVVNVTVNANTPPTTSITSPANGTLFTTVPASITINANASDSDGAVTQVLFFAGALNVGVDTASPYSCLWSGVGAGSYSLTTRAFDNCGRVSTSAAINITVRIPPVVTLTAPGSGSSYVAPANISLAATASSGGSITQVAFYSGSGAIGTDTVSPYSYSWNGVATGAYTLSARAWDNLGLVSTSAAANITVVAPVPGAEYPTNGALLYVNAAPSARKTINPRIYGVNIANWCQAYYLKICTPLLTNARVSVVRYGATNIERYNWRNNRMYNVISKENQYVPTSWRSFIKWTRDEVKAEPFLQTAVFGHVASDVSSNYYSYDQSSQDIIDWVLAAGTNVQIWGVGNEPFIAWKIAEYKDARTNGETYAYNDGAHGDQIYNEDIYHDTFFSNYIRVASAIRSASATATILGPTPANWWLYWGTDYSALCAAKRNNPGAHFDDNGWYMMANPANQADPRIFPERGGSSDVIGWEMDEITGKFNDTRTLCQFAKRMGEYSASHGGEQICNYLDFHRYMNTANDATAVQETRDLWDPDYQSFDKETGGSGTRTKILVRFNNIINHYCTNMMNPSLSEYDFFYWQGHPDEMQISALGQVDYLGVFPRQNVQMACNWYIGEPDQSGGGYEHAADAAKQAMFKEDGEPNPKYWALKLMSTHFRDQSLQTIASDNSQFSIYAGLETSSSQLTVVAAYKGQYVPWWDEHHAGAFIQGQGNSNATIVVSNFTITGVSKVLRYGRRDPGILMMAPGGVRVTNNTFGYEFEPLSIYLFQFNGVATPPAEQAPSTYVNVEPKRLDFGPYGSGSEQVRHHDEHTGETWYTTNFTHTLKISNTRNSNTTWQVNESCAWLAVVGPTSGVATVTDVIPLIVTNRALAVGVYSTDVQVVTSQGTMLVPVTMEIIPGEANGEKQLFDAETKSLAHTWSLAEPYSIGFYDGHGNPEDMDGPYIYDFSMDAAEKSGVGGTTSMRIDFDRGNGDNAAGKLYSAFGTYGHTNGTMVWVPTNASASNYVFKFDIKTKTEGPGFTSTKLLIVFSDFDGHKGKPKVGISSFKDCMVLQDGGWQTVSIPLNSLFYNWAYPSGQDGSYANLNFAHMKQVEFCPWVGAEDKRGTMWLDNIRIETLTTVSNKYPMAVAGQNKRLIGTNETVALSATNSYDPNGSIASYSWSPAAGLSSASVANPTFTPPGPGLYIYELVVTDNQGLKSRNPAQVVIKVTPTLVGSSIQFYRDAGLTQVITNPAANCLDVYVKLTCSAGGMANEADFTLATVSSTDVFPADTYNNVSPIAVVLNETGLDTKVFAGQFRLAAFSDELSARIGFKEGCTVKAAGSGVTNALTIGQQRYGFEKPIDYVERGDKQFNLFGGVWNSYNDNPNSNASVIYMASSTNAAHADSSQSMRGWGTLRLSPTGSVDQLFGGIMTKLTPYTNDGGNAYCDIGSPTGIKGISFWMKGNGKRLSVVLKSLAVTNYDDYLFTIEHTPTGGWKRFYLPLADFYQEGWGNAPVLKEDALSVLNAIQFKFASKINNETNEVFIDDLSLYGGSVQYNANAIYHKGNTVSMEGFGGLLVNGTFDGPGAPGWTMVNIAANENWGEWMAVMEHWNGSSASVGEYYQIVSNGISAGQSYKFDIQAQSAAGYSGRASISLVWLNAAGAALSTNEVEITSGLSQAQFITFTTDWRTAPANSAKVRVGFKSWNSTVPPYADNCVKFDNAVLLKQGIEPDAAWITTWTNGFSATYTTNRAEGEKAMQIGTSVATPGWLAGFAVAPYGQGVTLTNFSGFSAFSIKARRAPSYKTTGATNAQFRIAVCQGTNDQPAAKCRWIPVDASVWGDSIVIAKDKFYTVATVDDVNPANWAVWSNAWTDIGRIVIEYGPEYTGADPYDLLLDDFRPCNGTYLH